MLCQNLKFKIIILMQAKLTEFLLKLTFQRTNSESETSPTTLNSQLDSSLTSTQLIDQIYKTLNNGKNSKEKMPHKMSLSSEDTDQHIPSKCNCKKSKCLKLYCQCFARGSFCKDCNCDCCQNTKQFDQVRARAIDQMMIKSSVPFGYKTASSKGCNCKKTGCQKKYCECFSQGVTCNEHCKCSNCENCSH